MTIFQTQQPHNTIDCGGGGSYRIKTTNLEDAFLEHYLENDLSEAPKREDIKIFQGNKCVKGQDSIIHNKEVNK